jgi:hypothetical protein
MPFRAAAGLSFAFALSLASSALGQAALREDFEDAEPRLRYFGGDVPYRIDVQQSQPGAHSGHLCEHLQLQMGRGTALYMGLPITAAHVIDELNATLWVKADRTGPQLVGRIVLPNTIDSRTGTAATVLVVGETYRDVGRWQPLRLARPSQQITREVRALQAQLGPQAVIDPREAYLDQLLLNVYTGQGGIRVWVDDLEVAGFVAARSTGTVAPPERWTPPAPPADAAAAGPLGGPKVTCQGSQLMVSGRPFFPRAIEHQGEPLEFLKKLGFNTVRLSRPPPPELLQEAAAVGMWLVAPPPFAGNVNGEPTFVPLTPLFDPVLAWDLGEGLSAAQFNAFCAWAKALRQADRGIQGVPLPLVCDALSDCRAYSRHVDILRPSRRPLGTTLELTDYAVWLRERPRLARPGTPIWTSVQTQVALEHLEQTRRLAPEATPRSTISSQQLWLITYAALSGGARGLLFESRSRLDARESEAHRRALMLELLNLELSLIEPWVAAGALTALVPGVATATPALGAPPRSAGAPAAAAPPTPPTAAPDQASHVQAAVLQTERARLLMPLWLARGAQFVAGQSAANNVSFVVPGVPANHDAYEISACGMRRLEHQRVTRGVRVTLQEFGLTSLVVFTSDPLVLRTLTERVQRTSQRAGQLLYELAVGRLLQVEEILQQLSAVQAGNPQAAQYLAGARSMLQDAEAALRGRRFDEAHRLTGRALRPVLITERALWEQTCGGASPISSPLTARADTLLHQVKLMRRLQTAQLLPNRLPGGDCEDVERMRSAGWRLSQHAAPGVSASADVAPSNPHSGRFSLRLQAAPTDPAAPPDLLESPPLWLTTPAVSVPAGGLVRIHGWVRVPAPITGSVDGLMILDSLSGPALAARVDVTTQWQEFTLLRAAGDEARETPLVVTFVLTGLGEAWLDDVTIEPVVPR